MVKALVIGGCGLLGHHVVRQLLDDAEFQSVAVIDIRTTHNRFDGVEYYEADIASLEKTRAIISTIQPEVIIHTASPRSESKNIHIYEVGIIQGTRNLLEAASECGIVKAFVYTSSSSVVHNHVDDLFNADENLPLVFIPQQIMAYSHCKAITEGIVHGYNRKNGTMLTTCLRPATIYGEGDMLMTMSAIESAKSGKTKFQIGPNKALFEITYAPNTAYAHILAAKALLDASQLPKPVPEARRVEGESFFVSDGSPMRFWDFVRGLGAAAGYPTKSEDVKVLPVFWAYVIATILEWGFWVVTWGRREPTLTRSRVRAITLNRTFCINKLRQRLGYRPIYTVEEAIQRTGHWYSESEKKKL